jgi:hypothetical protein
MSIIVIPSTNEIYEPHAGDPYSRSDYNNGEAELAGVFFRLKPDMMRVRTHDLCDVNSRQHFALAFPDLFHGHIQVLLPR